MPASAVAMAAYILPALLSFGRFGGFSLMILAWIIPLLIYIRENSSGLVQFHAMQAFLLYLLSGLLHLAAFILNRHLLMGAIAAFDIARAPLGVTLTFLLLQLPGYVLPLLGSYFAVRVARFNREYSLPLLGFLTHALLKKM